MCLPMLGLANGHIPSQYDEAGHYIGQHIRILSARRKSEKVAVLILSLITGPERI
jgi:hypothetical protein